MDKLWWNTWFRRDQPLQRVVPSLGGGPGYGASADDVWTVDNDVLNQVKDDDVIIAVLDLGIAQSEDSPLSIVLLLQYFLYNS